MHTETDTDISRTHYTGVSAGCQPSWVAGHFKPDFILPSLVQVVVPFTADMYVSDMLAFLQHNLYFAESLPNYK